MKVYDLVKRALELDPGCRNSDKKLIWEIWSIQGVVNGGYLSYYDFLGAQSPETIRRSRQQVQKKQEHGL